MTAIMYSEHRVRSLDGTELAIRHWAPETPVADLLLIHGYLEHSGRYREFAQHLGEFGIATTAFDCRGHGHSGGARAYVGAFERYHEDVATVRATISTGLPVFLMGHSNGALIAFDHLSRDHKGYSGLIVTNPWTAPADGISKIAKAAAKILGRIAPKAELPAGLKSEDLTHDEEVIVAHRNDPLIIRKFTVGWAVASEAAQARVRNLTCLPLPFLFAYSDADRIAHSEVNRSLSEQLQHADKTVICRPGEFHEILNETRRADLFNQIGHWITRRC